MMLSALSVNPLTEKPQFSLRRTVLVAQPAHSRPRGKDCLKGGLARSVIQRAARAAPVSSRPTQDQFQAEKAEHCLAMEPEVGITVFRSGSQGYSAILKHRYKDFLVNEVDGRGNIVRLTSTDLPQGESEVEPEVLAEEGVAQFRLLVAEHLDQEQLSCVDSFLQLVRSTQSELQKANAAGTETVAGTETEGKETGTEKDATQAGNEQTDAEEATKKTRQERYSGSALIVETQKLIHLHLGPLTDKAARTAVHGAVSSQLGSIAFASNTFNPSKLLAHFDTLPAVPQGLREHVSAAVNLPKAHFIQVSFHKERFDLMLRGEVVGHYRRERKVNHGCVQAVLQKENQETWNALRKIGQRIKVPLKRIGVAGVKDKRGVTTQLVTFEHVDPKLLSRVSIPGIVLGNFQPVKQPMCLGDHGGNYFEIVLRDL